MATLDQSNTSNTSSMLCSAYSDNSANYRGSKITIGAAGRLDSVKLYLVKVGTGGAAFSIVIRADASGYPGAAISNTITLDPSTLTTSLDWYTFTFTTKPVINIGDIVHIIIGRYTGDENNHIRIGYGNLITGAEYANSGAWYLGGYDLNYEEYYNPGPTNLKSVDGLGNASVKSKNGLAIASIKSINGLV